MGLLEKQVAAELAQWAGFKAAGLDEKKIAESLARPPKADMGDLAFATFKFAKEAGKNPAQFAQELVTGAPVGATLASPASPARHAGDPRVAPTTSGSLIAGATAAGPYVNVMLNRGAACQAALTAIESREVEYGDSKEGNGKTLVVDLSSPNIAKPLAVHHLRSTMIGYSIKKIRESQGWRVVGINHLGDWGTSFGKLIVGIKRAFPELQRPGVASHLISEMLKGQSFDIKFLLSTYQRFVVDAATDPTLAEEARQEFAQLESDVLQKFASKDALLNLAIWGRAKEVSLAEFERVYSKLGLNFIDAFAKDVDFNKLSDFDYRQSGFYVGESFYVGARDLCGEIVKTAKAKGVAETSEGATVIFTDGKKKPPVMLLKSDGATSYHTRDMASALYRQNTFGFQAAAYVVGGEQSLHFQQLFKALEMLGYEWAKSCSHVDFGLMLFKNDKGGWEKTSTRRGTSIMLEDLLDEAIKAVREIIAEKNPELAADKAYTDSVSAAVGVGAVVFNDLKNGRRNNIKFDWDAVLDFQGESGPYMQMQYVRMCSVLEKFNRECEAGKYAGWQPAPPDLTTADVALLTHEEEWKLVLQLAAFPDAIAKASAEFEPSIVARYLIELASLTSTWWTVTKDTRIVGDDPALSLARVRLVNAIRKVLGRGLTLLGMSLVERM